jgi:hypothetical protein
MRVLLTSVLVLSVAPIVWAQAPNASEPPQTRQEALRREREVKAGNLTPNRPDPLQRGLAIIEERGLFLIARDGFHPKIGSLTTGSGFAFGVGYRTRAPFRRYGTLETFAAGSFKKYWALETRAMFPDLARGRIVAEAVASLREYPRENFFGLGPDSTRDRDSTFLLRTARVGASAGVKPLPFTTLGGGIDYLTPRVGRGRGAAAMEDLFSPVEVPGLAGRADFVRSSVFGELDYREPKNARRGGYYRVERSHFDDRESGAFTFNRTDVDLRQFFGFLAGRRVIALRALMSTTDAPEGNEVPFYLMPWLGGKDTLRGYRDYRFRGLHSLLLQAEYRWEIWSGLEGALFYDTGKVAMARRDLGLNNMEKAYGFGFRFNTDNAVVMRFDAAFGSRDGKRLHMAFGGVF